MLHILAGAMALAGAGTPPEKPSEDQGESPAFQTLKVADHNALNERLGGKLPFVPVIKVQAGQLVFISGVVGVPEDYDPKLRYSDTIEVQAERVFSRLEDRVRAAGGSLQDIVQVTKFMTNLDDHPAVTAVMLRHFGDHLPTSTTVEVQRLIPVGFGLEVNAIAVIRPSAP